MKKLINKILEKISPKLPESQCSVQFVKEPITSIVKKDLLSQLDRQTKEISDMINSALVNVTRLEVIDHQTPETGRVYVKRDCEKIELSIQDFGNTLKVFISKKD